MSWAARDAQRLALCCKASRALLTCSFVKRWPCQSFQWPASGLVAFGWSASLREFESALGPRTEMHRWTVQAGE